MLESDCKICLKKKQKVILRFVCIIEHRTYEYVEKYHGLFGNLTDIKSLSEKKAFSISRSAFGKSGRYAFLHSDIVELSLKPLKSLMIALLPVKKRS